MVIKHISQLYRTCWAFYRKTAVCRRIRDRRIPVCTSRCKWEKLGKKSEMYESLQSETWRRMWRKAKWKAMFQVFGESITRKFLYNISICGLIHRVFYCVRMDPWAMFINQPSPIWCPQIYWTTTSFPKLSFKLKDTRLDKPVVD